MRIATIGDIHGREILPYANSFSDGRKKEWADMIDKIVSVSDSCDIVVLLGDVLNSKHNKSGVIRELVEFLKRLGNKPVYIISGNHCRINASETALDFLKKVDYPNWHVFTEITQGLDIGGVRATFLPYTTPAMLGVTTKQEGEKVIADLLKPADIAFGHHAIMGAKATEFFDTEIVLDKKKMSETFGMSFMGHLHQAEKLGDNIQMTGSVFPQEIGEICKSIFVWDTVTKTTEEIALPVRQIHKVDWNEDSEKIFGGIQTNAIVKCVVTTRGTDIDLVHKTLERFDAHLVVEQYPSERVKTHFDEGALDLGIDNLLKLYSEAKGVSYADLNEGFNLIKQ